MLEDKANKIKTALNQCKCNATDNVTSQVSNLWRMRIFDTLYWTKEISKNRRLIEVNVTIEVGSRFLVNSEKE